MRAYLPILIAAAVVSLPAHSQDMNVLQRHLEHQQSVRVQDHQNRMRSPDDARKARQTLPRCTENHVPKADYDRIKSQYDQKVLSEGRQSANQWSQQTANAWYNRLRQQGVCR